MKKLVNFGVLVIPMLFIAVSTFAADPVPVREGTPKTHSNDGVPNPLAFNITPTTDTDILRDALVVPNTGITITSVTFTGAPTAAGLYVEGPFNMENGIILATGDVTNALPPNTGGGVTTDFGLAGCPECDAIIPGYQSFDAAKLEIVFDVSDSCNSISFEFVFGSEEYPEFVGSSYNDVFGAYLNGVQVSFDNNGNAITINGPFFSSGAVQVPPTNGMEYDGSTTKLKTMASVESESTGNTLVLVICDAGDHILDSGVLLRSLKGDVDSVDVTGPPPEFGLPSGLNCGDTLYVNVNDSVTFTIEAFDNGTNNDLVLLSVGPLPPGASMNPSLPLTGNPVISTFSWTPTVGQAGSYLIALLVEDSVDGLSDNCSFIILVEDSGLEQTACFIEPDVLPVYWANAVEPMTLPCYLGNLADDLDVADINMSSLIINDSLIPISYSIISDHPQFGGDAIEIMLDMADFIHSYSPVWGTLETDYTISGTYAEGEPFECTGSVTIIGHISGDLNLDGQVDISDMILMVEFMFQGVQFPQCFDLADINCSGEVDIADLVHLVDFMFTGGPKPILCQ